MKGSYKTIINHALFEGVLENELDSILTCLGSFERKYKKNQTIMNESDYINYIGFVVSGTITITKCDYYGNEVIITKINEGDIFGEVFACAKILTSPVTVVASSEATVLFLDYKKIITTCTSACMSHQKLISNMLTVISHKTLYLNKRVDILSKKTLRDKIITFLNYESNNSSIFTIAMNREELAKFLCADRSALSNELSKMQSDCIIKYHKNTFELL